jgi:hypothetical protein
MNHAPNAPAKPTRVSLALSDAQREWIVRRLAADDSPTAIQRDVRERFDIEISFQTITYYDPSRVPACGKRWAELFHTVRDDRIAGRAELTTMAGRVERLALRIVAILESRVVVGPEARGCAKDAGAITHEDRLRALLHARKRNDRLGGPASTRSTARTCGRCPARSSRRGSPTTASCATPTTRRG